MRKLGNVLKKMWIMLALALCLCAVSPDLELMARAQETAVGTVFIQMPGFIVEQWSAPKLMSVTRSYNVRVLPDTSAQKLGQLQAGTYVNAWGQTDTGWYFVECAGTLGYVRYEAAVPVADLQAAAQAQAQAAAQAQQAAAQAQQAAAQAQAAAVQAQNAAAVTQQTAAVVFIGDSRMVGMEKDLTEAVGHCPVTVVAQNGARHEWLESTGIPRADKVIGAGTKVLINLGVNDLSHVQDYLELVNPWAAVWIARGAQVYYASVNPVYANPHNMTEERVTVFNRELRAGLIPQITWIDSNTYLKQTGVKSNDGIHYLPVTNLVLYQYYMAMLGLG